MEEIKDIAMWEETDSILAKRTAYDRGYYNCSRHDRDILERKHQQLEHIEQVNKKLYERIDKAIEYIDTLEIDEDDNSQYGGYSIFEKNNYNKCFSIDEILLKIEDILRGEDNEN